MLPRNQDRKKSRILEQLLFDRAESHVWVCVEHRAQLSVTRDTWCTGELTRVQTGELTRDEMESSPLAASLFAGQPETEPIVGDSRLV